MDVNYKKKWIDALLECPNMHRLNLRMHVVDNLQEFTKQNIRYSSHDWTHVGNIVDTVIYYEDGLGKLVTILRDLEENSYQMQGVEDLYADYLVQIVEDIKVANNYDIATIRQKCHELEFYIDKVGDEHKPKLTEAVQSKQKKILQALADYRREVEDWEGAIMILDQLQEMGLSDKEYMSRVQGLEEKRHIMKTYQKACSHFGKREYTDAVIDFADIVYRNPHYKDVSQKLLESLRNSSLNTPRVVHILSQNKMTMILGILLYISFIVQSLFLGFFYWDLNAYGVPGNTLYTFIFIFCILVGMTSGVALWREVQNHDE